MFKLGALALLALVAAALAAVVAMPAKAEASSLIAIFNRTSAWDSGYIGQYTITNRGGSTVTGWTLEFDLPPGQTLTSAWSAKVTPAGNHQVFTAEDWTRSIPSGRSVQLGFEVSASGGGASTASPSNCTIDGQPCAGATSGSTSTTTMTAPANETTTGPASPPTTGTTPTPALTPAPTSPTAVGLTAMFRKTSDWGSGFVGEYTIANGGSSPVNGWRLEFDLGPNEALTSVWSARMSASGQHFVLTPESWTSSIPAGGAVIVGFQGSASGVFRAPQNCLLNGAACADGSGPSGSATTAPTSAAPAAQPIPTNPSPPPPAGLPPTAPGTSSGVTRPGFVPYVDMTLSSDSLAAMSAASGVKRFTLAFIVSGAPCQASWGGYYGLADAVMAKRISDLQAAGGEPIVSFGGAINQELARTCPTVDALTAQYQAVIDRYGIRDLDFDIEGADQTDAATLTRRFQAISRLQAAAAVAGRPLRISLTLPVMPWGLTDAGLGVVRAAIDNGVDVGTVNVMAMDYFDPALAPFTGRMGEYAVQAASAVQRQLASLYPAKSAAALWGMVGVTPMLGINDDPAEVFTTADAAKLTAFARQQGLGRLSMWSINRDRPCPQATTTTQNTCSGVSDPPWAFSAAFLPFGA